MADISRVTPLSISPRDSLDTTADMYKKHIVTHIQLGVRVGQDVNIALGFIQGFNWSIDRPVTEVHQIEPIPDGTFSSSVKIKSNDGLFNTKYYPGEVIELIPGKQGAVSIDISRCVLYGSNILSALMFIEKAGTEESKIGSAEASSFDPTDSTSSGSFAQYVTLIQQVRPVYIKQIILNPVSGEVAYGRVFEDVWIESMSEEQVTADKNEPLVESIKAKATRIRPFIIPKTEGDKKEDDSASESGNSASESGNSN